MNETLLKNLFCCTVTTRMRPKWKLKSKSFAIFEEMKVRELQVEPVGFDPAPAPHIFPSGSSSDHPVSRYTSDSWIVVHAGLIN